MHLRRVLVSILPKIVFIMLKYKYIGVEFSSYGNGGHILFLPSKMSACTLTDWQVKNKCSAPGLV